MKGWPSWRPDSFANISAYRSGRIATNHKAEASSRKLSEQLRSELCYHTFPSDESYRLAQSYTLAMD